MVDDCNWQTADVETVFSVHRRRVQQPGMELHPFLAICVMAVILIAFSFSDNIFVHYSRRRGVMSPTMAHRDVICWLKEAYAESH